MHTTGGKVTAIRHADINRGVEWITGGVDLFMKKPGELMIAGLALFIVSYVLHQVPILIGGPASLIGVMATGAMTLARRAVEEGNGLLAGGRKAATIKPLWILSLIAFGLGSVVAVLGYVLAEAVGGALSVSPMFDLGLGALLLLLSGVPLVMALWLAPGLVVLKGCEPVAALRLSFAASVDNFLPFLVLYIFAGIATMLGSMLMGLGVIFVYPVLLCATCLAWKDLFK